MIVFKPTQLLALRFCSSSREAKAQYGLVELSSADSTAAPKAAFASTQFGASSTGGETADKHQTASICNLVHFRLRQLAPCRDAIARRIPRHRGSCSHGGC